MVLTRGGYNRRGPVIRRQPYVSSQLSSQQTTSNDEMNDNAIEANYHSHTEELHGDQEEMGYDDDVGHNENGEEVEFSDETDNPDATQILHKTERLWFHSCEVVDEVVETSYKTYFMGPWNNWA